MNSLSRSVSPSYVSLPPNEKFSTIFQFLLFRFPRISDSVWRERIVRGKVHFDDGEALDLTTPYQAHRRICYYREVSGEARIPFTEEVLFENDDFLVADKPHFLPVHPAGKYVNETLITRLRARSGCADLISAHRIDRSTAGLVLCIKNPALRGRYQNLFMNGTVKKTYLAAARIPPSAGLQTHWHLQAHMEPREDHFRMQIVPGRPVNSESFIDLIARRDEIGLFRLQPVTGKKHQLRVHLCAIGSGILNDPFYTDGSDKESADDYDRPMQLLACRLEFADPLTGAVMRFVSKRSLRGFPEWNGAALC